ncbi:MAG: MoaD/ThiS family protein [Chloroflexota bacterium]|nr:MoaD/ThiS family protein [Chloroflexota bacterium]
MAQIWIPPQIQNLTHGREIVTVEGSTVRQLINNLDAQYPGIKNILYDEEEEDIMPRLAVIVDGEASQLGVLERVSDSSEVHFLPAIGGGIYGITRMLDN